MRRSHASVATWVLASALAGALPASSWAVPQAASQAVSPNAAVVSDGPAAVGPSAAAKPDEGEKTVAGTAQELEVPSGFGRLIGTLQVDGDVQVGYRFVDVNGAENKYREQYDFDEGLRILNTRLVVTPEQRGGNRAFDRITLSGNGLGGDPYETWNLSAYKTGAYNASVRYRSVDFFYGDLGDPHAWDTQRRYIDVDLRADLTSDVMVFASFNRYRRNGERQVTRDFDRDEFHYLEPVDQEGTTYGFGIRWDLGNTDLFFNQDFVNFRDNSGFTSGPNAGGPTATFIEMLSNTEVRAMDSPISRGGFHTVALDSRLEVFGDLMYSDQQTSSAFVQTVDGLDRSGRDVQVTWDNQGLTERQVLHANLQARVRAHRLVIVTAKYRHRDWDQDGSGIGEDITLLTASGSFSSSRGTQLSSYRVKGDQFMFGAEVMPVPSMSLFGEVGFGSVDKAFDKTEIGSFPHGSDRKTDVTTESVPLRIGGFYRPDRRVDVKLTYSRDDADDPLTQVFPTTADGFKLRTRFRPLSGWTVAADVTYRKAENDISNHEFDSKTFAASLSHMIGERGNASIGYNYLDSASSVPFRFVLDDRTEGNSVSSYEAQTSVVVLSGDYALSPDGPAKLYGSLAYVDNSGTIPLSRYDIAFGGRYTFDNGIFVDAQARFIDYQQQLFHEQGIILSPAEPSDVNDYDAKLFTLGMGFRFH